MAVAHSILIIAYHLLPKGHTYEDLGVSYFDQRDRQGVQRQLVRRSEALGYNVHLEPAA